MSKTILLIQDDCRDAQAVREALIHASDGNFQVEWVRLCSEGLKRLAEEGKPGGQPADTITAVLVDLFLPDSRGIDTFDRLFRLTPEIPILVLSASAGRGCREARGSPRGTGLSPESAPGRIPVAEAAQHGRARRKRRGVIRGKRARTGHAQLHRRRGYQHRCRRTCDLSQCRRRRLDRLVARGGGRPSARGGVSNRRRHHPRARAESHGAGHSGEQNRRPHVELRPDPARRHRSRHRRLRRTHPRSPGTRDRRRHGVS